MASAQPAFCPYERIDELEEEVRQLKELLSGEVDVLPFERTTPQARRAINCLMRLQSATREQLYCAIHGFEPEADPKGVDVVLHRARKVLRRHGVEIQHIQAHMWAILPEDKERLRNV